MNDDIHIRPRLSTANLQSIRLQWPPLSFTRCSLCRTRPWNPSRPLGKSTSASSKINSAADKENAIGKDEERCSGSRQWTVASGLPLAVFLSINLSANPAHPIC